MMIVPKMDPASKSIIKGEMSSAGTDAGNGFNLSFGKVLRTLATSAVVIGAARGVANTFSSAFDSYADYEQLSGGIESMFQGQEELIESVTASSRDAWQTLTMSQNEYYSAFMSAYPLIASSLDSQEDAIATTNKLLGLESDLANTFGYDMDYAATAINWALKGSYNYLDNLNIGITGTKEGFLEAANACGLFDHEIKDLDELTSEEKIAVIENYANRYGVLGKTADEAGKTIQGSQKMLHAAWQNLLTDIAAGGDIASSIDVLMKALFGDTEREIAGYVTLLAQTSRNIIAGMVSAFAEMIPRLAEQIPEVIEMFTTLASEIMDTLMDSFPEIIEQLSEQIPNIINMFMQLAVHIANALATSAPIIIPAIAQMIVDICAGLVSNVGLIIQAAADLVAGLAQGLIDALPIIVEAVPDLIGSIVGALNDNLDLLIGAALDLVTGLAQGIIGAIPVIVDALPELIEAIVATIIGNIPVIIQAGIDLLSSLIDALPEIISTVVTAIPDIVYALQDAILEGDNLETIAEAGVDLFVSLVTMTPEIIAGLIEAVPKIVQGLADSFKSQEMKDKMKDAGKQLLLGLKNGFTAAMSELLTSARGVGNSLVGAFKSTFGIHSPSTVFAEIGENLMLGLGNGIDNKSRYPQDRLDLSVGNLRASIGTLSHAQGVVSTTNNTTNNINVTVPARSLDEYQSATDFARRMQRMGAYGY